jgi:TP901 family phage tail tape measure protein
MLPPVIQTFGIAAGEFLAGLDQMIARDEQLAGSLDGVIAGSGAMGAALDEQAAAFDRAAAAAGLYVDASGRVREANGRFASSATMAAAGLDEEAAAARRAAVATGQAGDAAVAAGGKSKAGAAEAAGFGSTMKTAFLGVAIAGGYGIEKAAKFQASMAQLHTQAGVAQSTVKSLSQGVLQLAGQVGEGPDSLSESLYHVASNLASLGVSGPQMLSAVKVAAEGAQIGGANLVDVTNALGAAIASGIPGVQDYTQAMGYMNATVGAGDMHMQDLADAFGTGVLANIKLYGVTLQDVSAALATFGDNNIRGAKAGTDLRMAVQGMVQPMKTAGDTLKMLGLNEGSFADAMKKGGLNQALQLLVTRMHAAGVSAKDEGQVITDLFGKKAGSGIGVLVGEFDRFQGKFKDVQKGANAFAGDWAARSQTMQQQWNNLKSGAQALAVSFGTLLLPAATKVVGALAKFGTFLEQHPAIAAFAGAILAVAVAFKVVAAAEAIFNLVTIENPVMAVIIAVIALAAGLYELYTHFKVVRDVVADVGRFFEATWKLAVQAAGAVIKWFENGPLKDIEKAIAYFRQWWAQNGAEVAQAWRMLWGVIKAIFTAWWGVISAEVKASLAILLAIWRVSWGAIKDATMWAFNVIKAEVTMVIHIVMDIISIFLDIVTGHWSKAWKDIQKLFHDAVNGIVSIAKAWASGFIRFFSDLGRNIISGLINGIKSMFGAVGSVVSSLGHGILNTFTSIFHTHSPSRKTYELGVNVAQGLALGITFGSKSAYDAAKQASRNIALLFAQNLFAGLDGTASQVKSVISKLLTAVKQEMDAGLITEGQGSSLTRFLDADNRRLQSLATQRASIAKTIAAAQKYAATTTSNTEQAFGLMSVAGSTPLTAGDIATGLKQDVSQIVAFKNNIAKLAKMGLNKAYIDQLIQAGPVSGGQVAAELAAGNWADIKAINSAESQIASASTSLGRTAAEAMYDSGAQAGKGFLSGLMAQQKAIEQMMARIAKAVIDTMKRELKISSPSRVFMDHGRSVIDGFLLGMEGGPARAGAAMRSLAGATTMPHGGIGAGFGGGGATSVTINVHVDGFVGSNQQLAGEIYRTFQSETLRANHRNPSNGLSLAFGRG